MVHSVELVFDDESDAELRRVWDDLTEAGVRSQASHTSASNRPHVTLMVAETMANAVDDALRPLLAQLPLRCRIGAPMLFGGGPFALVRLVVPSAELLALHSEVYRVCLPHMTPGPLPHAEPGAWTAHVTLARRLDAALLPQALAVRSVGREVDAVAVGLRHWDGNARVEHPISRRD